MSLLWPETITAGLFPDQCWVRRNGSECGQAEAAGPDFGAWLDTFDALLSGQSKRLGKLSRLRVVISDSACMLTQLPWLDELRKRSEIEAYAQACFARLGREADSDWALEAGFRWYRAGGIAYALPRKWLAALQEVAQRHQVRLVSVLPASAAAYWYCRLPAKATSMVMLAEAGRVTALIYESGSFRALDVQPITQDLSTGGRRLLSRIITECPNIRQVHYWCSGAGPAAGDETFISASLPLAKILRVDHAWRVQ